MPMMVIAMMTAATPHPMAAHRPPNTIQSTLSSRAIGDIGEARGYDGAGLSWCRTHYIEAEEQRQTRAGSGGDPAGVHCFPCLDVVCRRADPFSLVLHAIEVARHDTRGKEGIHRKGARLRGARPRYQGPGRRGRVRPHER